MHIKKILCTFIYYMHVFSSIVQEYVSLGYKLLNKKSFNERQGPAEYLGYIV